MKGGMPDHDLKALGEVLEQGQAGVLVVYATNIANQVAANVKAAMGRQHPAAPPAPRQVMSQVIVAVAWKAPPGCPALERV
jgi:hypothetical protein